MGSETYTLSVESNFQMSSRKSIVLKINTNKKHVEILTMRNLNERSKKNWVKTEGGKSC